MKTKNGTNPAECIKNAKKIVLKIGSNTLAKKDGTPVTPPVMTRSPCHGF